MRILKRETIENIGKEIFDCYRKLPEVKKDRIIYNVHPDLLIEKLLGFKVDHQHLSLTGDILGITCTEEVGIEVYGEDDSDDIYMLDGKTILIEKDLLYDQKRFGQYQYTKCHEASHLIFKIKYPSDYGARPGELPKPQFSHASRANNKGYISDWGEWQADVLAASILMPTELILQNMFWAQLGDRIKLLNSVYAPAVYERFCNLASMLGVSKQALAYRMQRLGLIEINHFDDPYQLIRIERSEYDKDNTAR